MTLYHISLVLLGILPPAILFALARFDKHHGVPHPLRVVAWVLILGYSLKSFYLYFAVRNGLHFRTDYFTSQHLYLGQLMVLLGVASFAFGFAVFSRLRLRKSTTDPKRRRSLIALAYWPFFAAAVAAVAMLFYLKGLHQQVINLSFAAAKFYVSEETGTQSSLGFLLLGADVLVVYFLYYLGVHKKLLAPNVFLPAILFVALTYFLSSQRTGVLIIIIGAIMVGRVGFFQFNSKKALKRLAFVGLALSILSTSSYIRSNYVSSVNVTDLSIAAGYEKTLEHVFEGTYALDPAKLTGIALRHDEYRLGESFAMFLVAPIPRMLWPQKPNVRLGPYVAQEILDYTNTSGVPPSAIGEFYINFGIGGIIVGMFLLGGAAVLARAIYLRSEDPDIARVRYALMLLVIIYFLIGDFSYAALFIIKYGVAASICEAYWYRRLRQERRQAISEPGLGLTA